MHQRLGAVLTPIFLDLASISLVVGLLIFLQVAVRFRAGDAGSTPSCCIAWTTANAMEFIWCVESAGFSEMVLSTAVDTPG